jgi:hypothetical protein
MEEDRQTWQDTALRLQLGPFDAWVLAPLLLWFYHWRWWTLETAGAGVVFFIGLNMYGMTPVTFWRALRCRLLGKVHPAIEPNDRRRLS